MHNNSYIMGAKKSKPTSLEIGLMVLASAVFLILIAQIDRPPFYDEDEYLLNVRVLEKYGLGRSYLLNLIGSAGPLFSVIHYLFEPLTHLRAPYVRFINLAFLLGTIYFISHIINSLRTTKWSYSVYIMSIPLTYVIGGLALTEMPALFFYSIAIFFAIRAADDNTNLRTALIYSTVGGLCLSLAILGRQPYLLTLIAFPLLFLTSENVKKNLIVVISFVVCAIVLPLLVFWVWKDLVPPQDGKLYTSIAESGTSFKVVFIFNFLFYAAISMFFIAPTFYKPLNTKTIKILLFAFLLIFAFNYSTDFLLFLPIKTILRHIFPHPVITFGERFFGASVILLGGYCLVLLFTNLKDLKYKREVAFFVAAIILLAIASGKITWGFSSRYTSQSIPLMLGLGSYFYRNSHWNAVRILIGVSLGLLSVTFQYLDL